jgi:hypothetical protein
MNVCLQKSLWFDWRQFYPEMWWIVSWRPRFRSYKNLGRVLSFHCQPKFQNPKRSI